MVTTGFGIYTSYKPWPIGVYVSYTRAYVRKFIPSSQK